MARPGKTALLARTAIGGVALLGSVAHALPGAPVNIAVNPGGSAPVLTTPDTATLDIKFNAARTVLQYNGFDVAAGEAVNLRFDARSDIGVIHNVGEGAINIDGALRSFVGAQAGGNVWLLSSSGVFFGANARVDVGGLLASTAVPSNLLSAEGGVLDPTRLSFDFANGAGQVSIAAGAQITGHGGTLALIAPSVVSFGGSTVSGDGGTSVLYGGVQAYTVRFVREASDDLDLLDFEVPGLTAGSDNGRPLDIGGTTSAGNVYLASVGKAQTVASVLRADGDITATSAGLEGGTIVLTAGGGIANRAATPVFTDGIVRQRIETNGVLDAARDITGTATGDIGLFGDVRAGGSIASTGLNIRTTNLTAGLDVVLHGGDPIGSTAIGYGYGYSASGGDIDIFRITAGRDVTADTWNGFVGVNEIVLAGIGPDGSATGKLLLQTTGDFGDIYLGRDPGLEVRGVSANALTGGADTRLDGVGYVQVRSSGPVALTNIVGGASVNISVDGALNVGSITTAGYIFAESLQSVAIGSATTTSDGNGNGQIVLFGGTGASIVTANAATDLIVVTDHGDAVAGTVTVGDDVVLRATLGNAVLTSATIGGGPDVDGNFVNRGEGGFTFFAISPDNSGYGHFVDLSATRTDPNQLLPDNGGDVRLGLATGTIAGYDGVRLDAERDIAVDLAGIATAIDADAGHDATILATGALIVDSIFAGNNALVASSAGDTAVGYGTAGFDLSVLAPLGLASLSQGAVGGSFRLDGRTVELGQLSGSDGGSPQNVTIRTTAGDFDYFGLSANNDLILDISGAVDVASLSAGRDILVTAGGAARVGQSGEGGGFVHAGRDLFLTAASLDIGAPLSAGRDLSLTTTVADLDVVGQQFDAGQDIRLTAAGPLTADTIDAVRDVLLEGASVAAAQVAAGRDASVVARSGDAVIEAASVRQDLSVLAALGLASVGDAQVGRDVVLSGGGASLGSLGPYSQPNGYGVLAPPRDLTVTTTGDFVATGALALARDARFDIAGTLTLAGVDAGGDITARAARIDLGSATAGDDIRLNGAMITAANLTTSGAGDSEADGSNIVATGTDVRIDTARAVGDVSVTALGALTLGQGEGSIAAGRDIFASGGTLTLGSLDAGRDLSLIATASGIDAHNVGAVRDLTIGAAGALGFGDVAAGRDLRLAGASVGGGAASAGGALSVTGRSGAVNIGDIAAGSDAIVVALAGNVVTGDAAVARDLTITAAQGLAQVGDAHVGQDFRLGGASVGLASLDGFTPQSRVRDVVITATAGGLTGAPDLTVLRDIAITVSGAASLGMLAAGNDVIIGSGGTLTLAGLTAGRDATLVSSGAIAASTVSAGDDLRLTASGSVTVAQLAAPTSITVTGGGAVSIGQAASSGDVIVSGATVGGTLQLSGRDIAVSSGGALTAGAGLDAARDLRLTAGTILGFTGLDSARDLILTAAIVQGGSAVAARDLTVIATTRIGGDLYQAGRTLLLDPNEVIQATTVRAGGDATLIGASVDIGTLEVGGTTLVQATAGGVSLDSFTSGGAAILLATGGVALGAATNADLRIVAGDLDVRRSLVAASLTVETPGRMIVGGTAITGEQGFRLAAADIALIRVAGTTSFYAGLTATVAPPGGDLVLQDLAYDPANLPSLAFYADRSHVVDVQGRILPSVTGGSIVIGDADPAGRFRPGSIYVSGGFGAADLVANCYGNIVAVGSLSLYSVNDVIFGAADFRIAIQAADPATINLVAGSPAIPAGPADNRLFAVANRFVVDGAGKIVSQNTAADAGAYVGLFFNGLATSGPVISVGNARAIDLAGSLIDSAGELRSGQSVAFAGGVGGGGNGVVFRFNGCIVGAISCGSGSGASPAEALRLEDYRPPRPLDLLDEPLSTVLIETPIDDLEVLTIGTGADGIVIRRRKPSN